MTPRNRNARIGVALLVTGTIAGAVIRCQHRRGGEPGREASGGSSRTRSVRPPTPAPSTGASQLAISGEVRSRGRPVPGALVTLAGAGAASETRSDANGRFTFGEIRPGRYALRAERDQGAAYVEDLELPPASSSSDGGAGARPAALIVELHPAAAVSGRLRDPRGAAIVGGEVTLSEGRATPLQRKRVTGADGRFQFAGVLPGSYLIAARADGYLPTLPRELRAPAVSIQLRLERGGVLEGEVLDEQSRPIAGARVEVAGEGAGGEPIAISGAAAAPLAFERAGELGVLRGPIPYPPATPAPQPSSAPGFTTDARGRFRLSAIPPGRVVVAASHPEFARGVSEPTHVRAGADVKVRLVLGRGATVRGRVLGDREQPLAAAEVSSTDGRYATSSDQHGQYQMLHASGALELTVRHPGYLPLTKEAPAGGGIVDFQLAPARERLSGVVVDDRGGPVAAALVVVVAPGVEERRTMSDSAGRFAFEALPPGPYRLRVRHADFAPVERANLAPGAETRVELHPGGGVAGEVRDDRTGAVPPGTRVELRIGNETRALTLLRGRFEASALLPGPAWLEVTAPGFVPWARQLEIPAGRDLHQVTVRDLKVGLELGGTVAGRVLDENRDPVSGAEVHCGSARARTQAGGEFRLVGVEPGRLRLEAQGRGRSGARDVEVRAGDQTRADLEIR